MTQFQYDVICKLIDAGAPALAEELKGAILGLVQSLNAVVAENEQLKAKLDGEPDRTENSVERAE